MVTVIEHITAIDSTGSDPIEDATIVVEGETIRAVGRDAWTRRDGDTVVDGRGKYAVPGLMDMHTHLSIPSTSWDPGSDDPPVTDQSIAATSVNALQNARNFILKGITTIRDVGSQHYGIFAVKRMIEAGQLVGPTVVACGKAIAMTGGHGMIVAAIADGPDEVRRLGRANFKAGAECLKFMASGAGAESRQSPYAVELTQEEMAAGVTVARSHGGTSCAHSMNPESTRNAVLAGVNSIEHGLLLDESSLLLMKEHDVHYVPTLWTYQNTAENGVLYGVEDWMVAEVRRRVERHLENVRRANQLGVTISAGTDSGTPLNLRDSLFWELEWYVYCGLTPMAALQTATINNAKLLQRPSIGTLEADKIADILVVDADPLADIRNLKATYAVFKKGALMVLDGKLQEPRPVVDLRRVPDGPTPPPSWLTSN